MSRNTERGFTLAEVLLAAALLLVLMEILTQFLIPSLRYQSRSLTQTELMRQSYQVAEQVIRDLRLSPTSLLTYDASHSLLCGRHKTGWTPDGSPVFSGHCWFLCWQPPLLQRGESSDSSPLSSIQRLSLLEVQQQSASARWKKLANNLQEFQFEHQGVLPEAPAGLLKIRLTLALEGQSLVVERSVLGRLNR